MRIECPFCGERDSGEFVTAGDASVRRPNPDAPDAQARFVEAVYIRENPAGRHEELWYHGSGCRSWLKVTRDTRTHAIFTVELMKDVAGT
jgi:methylglutamate dehydrogenase subunit B